MCGVDQRGGHITAWRMEVPKESRGLGRRKLETRGMGPRSGSAAWAWLGGWLLDHRLRGKKALALGGFGCFFSGPSGPRFPTDLAPTKTRNIPREKQGIRGASASLGESRITRKSRTPDATKSYPENCPLQSESAGGIFERIKGTSLLLWLFFNKRKREIRGKVCLKYFFPFLHRLSPKAN